MKKIYTAGAQPAERTVTVPCMRKAKAEGRKLVQVTANTPEELCATEEAGIDMMVSDAANAGIIRKHNKTTFCTAAIKMTEHATTDDILREAFRALQAGADAIITPRSFQVVETLAREGIPVMGHLGLVPRKSVSIGGMRAVGKTAEEALELFRDYKRLECAGAFAVESEVIAAQTMAEIAKRTPLICVSLGSGKGGDVNFLFQTDLTGETPNPPRHVQVFGNLSSLHQQVHDARVAALTAFREAANSGAFPPDHITPTMSEAEYEKLLHSIDNI